MDLKDKIWENLKRIKDPEFDIDIVNLGLVYDVKVMDDGEVWITMTLTSPTCPLAEIIFDEIKNKIESLDEVKKVVLNITFDPPWDPSMMSDKAKEKLGLDFFE